METPSSPRTVLAVTNDLMARARLTDATDRAGADLEVTAPATLLDKLRSSSPDVLIVDLDAGGDSVIERIASARDEALLPARVIGYFSHVDAELARAARAAGCETMPRGKLWRSLESVVGEDVG